MTKAAFPELILIDEEIRQLRDAIKGQSDLTPRNRQAMKVGLDELEKKRTKLLEGINKRG